jgi:glycosyltransferase involved in cell wall biosynthesis
VNPEVSVILPVYNAEAFLKEAIDSVLTQTFPNFELLIINDGSTDSSDAIISSYRDERIRYLKNEGNKGLIYTLNRGIDEARGRYLARMDADDICFPERLQEQKAWLDAHSSTAVAATFCQEIDSNGKRLGFFAPDRQVISASQIRRKMPEQNCITHPSVMGRTKVFRQYRYSNTQRNIEDYDLWLRILSDGGVIEKVPKELLLYRVHSSSITQSKLRRKNFFFKHFHCKRRYLVQRISSGHCNSFDLRVGIEMLLDLVKGTGKQVKRIFVKQ